MKIIIIECFSLKLWRRKPKSEKFCWNLEYFFIFVTVVVSQSLMTSRAQRGRAQMFRASRDRRVAPPRVQNWNLQPSKHICTKFGKNPSSSTKVMRYQSFMGGGGLSYFFLRFVQHSRWWINHPPAPPQPPPCWPWKFEQLWPSRFFKKFDWSWKPWFPIEITHGSMPHNLPQNFW